MVIVVAIIEAVVTCVKIGLVVEDASVFKELEVVEVIVVNVIDLVVDVADFVDKEWRWLTSQ